MLASNPGRPLRRAPALCLILSAAACAQGGPSSQYDYQTTRYHYSAAATSYSASPGEAYAAARLQWPVSEGVVSSRFGIRHGAIHRGIDIGAPLGTPVRAAAAGTVIFAGRMRGYGRTIVLRHDAHRTTLYAHHRRIWVARGQYVRSGQVIGSVGRSGHASGPNLHFEVRVDHYAQNPLHYLQARPHLVTFAKQTRY